MCTGSGGDMPAPAAVTQTQQPATGSTAAPHPCSTSIPVLDTGMVWKGSHNTPDLGAVTLRVAQVGRASPAPTQHQGPITAPQPLKPPLQQEEDAQRAEHLSQGGDTPPQPPGPTWPKLSPRAPGATTVPHVPGSWHRAGRAGTDLPCSRISIIPVPAAWALLELPPALCRN